MSASEDSVGGFSLAAAPLWYMLDASGPEGMRWRPGASGLMVLG